MSDLKETLESLHEYTAKELTRLIEKGTPVKDNETGEVHYEPAPAAYFTAAIALLKHNNIQQVPTKKNGMGKLSAVVSTLPFPGADIKQVINGEPGKAE